MTNGYLARYEDYQKEQAVEDFVKAGQVIAKVLAPDYLQKEKDKLEKIKRFKKNYQKQFSLLLETINKIYDGDCYEIWDLLAILSGNDKGNGSKWFWHCKNMI